jgi:hypothetical protein
MIVLCTNILAGTLTLVAVVILRMYWWIPVSATAGKQGCQIFVGT